MRLYPQIPKGVAFTRLAIAKAVSNGSMEAAATYAENRWGNKDFSSIVTKAAVDAGSTEPSKWGSQLTDYNNAAREFFELVRAETIMGRLNGLRRIPLKTQMVSQMSGASARWVGEGRASPLSSSVYAADQMDAHKIIAEQVITSELLLRSDPEAEILIRDDLVRVIAEQIDRDFIDPANAGVTGEKPASITYGVTAQPSSGVYPDHSKADAIVLFDGFAGDLERSYWAINPSTAVTLNSETNVNLGARGGEYFGSPAITSKAVPKGLLAFIDPTGVAVGEGLGTVDTSTKSTIQMADDPTDPTAATVQVSLWQSNLVAIQATREMTWKVARPCVSLIAGVGT
ncbi:MAG: phage major capsid protein [Pseudomonadota bacterium]